MRKIADVLTVIAIIYLAGILAFDLTITGQALARDVTVEHKGTIDELIRESVESEEIFFDSAKILAVGGNTDKYIKYTSSNVRFSPNGFIIQPGETVEIRVYGIGAGTKHSVPIDSEFYKSVILNGGDRYLD